ncbi:hypothetical protein Q3G72_031981 [Acer saccharum]|nr:hypothetical protein Q3G72_031981 [Acer saccharum]
MKTLQNSEITKPRGIKTKPTVGRPRNKLKGVLERRKPQTKATKTKTTKQLSIKDCTPRGNAKEQQVVPNEIPMFNGLTRDTNFNEIPMFNANTNFVATTTMDLILGMELKYHVQETILLQLQLCSITCLLLNNFRVMKETNGWDKVHINTHEGDTTICEEFSPPPMPPSATVSWHRFELSFWVEWFLGFCNLGVGVGVEGS